MQCISLHNECIQAFSMKSHDLCPCDPEINKVLPVLIAKLHVKCQINQGKNVASQVSTSFF